MVASLRHRGPDDEGIWTDEAAGIGLGHRRLAVVDLSPAGHQPMVSEDGRYVLTFNGEIYNHLGFAGELDGAGSACWRGRSDTETLVEAIASLGAGADAAQMRRHVRARALGPPGPQALAGARPVRGEAALLRAGRRRFRLRLRTEGDPHPSGFCRDDRPPGARPVRGAGLCARAALDLRGHPQARSRASILTLDGAERPCRVAAQYWSYRAVVEEGLAAPLSTMRRGARGAGSGARRRDPGTIGRGRPDRRIPVGRHRFLDGRGAPSQAFVAERCAPIRSASRRTDIDEAPHARAVSRYLGTDHTERYVSSREAREVIPLLPAIYDEPFADPSQIPTYLMSKLAREEVDRRPLRRRRRRAVRRLYALSDRREPVAQAAAVAGSGPARLRRDPRQGPARRLGSARRALPRDGRNFRARGSSGPSIASDASTACRRSTAPSATNGPGVPSPVIGGGDDGAAGWTSTSPAGPTSSA